jgi:transglutaminase-like putative cysteine protease
MSTQTSIHIPLGERLRQLPRDKADTLLLLAAALMVLAPHFGHLPLWTSGAVCAILLWRAVLTWRGRRMPSFWILLPASLAAMAGVYASYRSLLGRDPGVAMLALLLAFKLLEMRARRDLFVVVFLGFFVLLTNFFYSQSIPTALFMVATLIVLLTALQTFQYTGAVPPLAQRLRTSGRIFLLAAPLAVLLFVAFPRIQGPLWGMPGDANSGRTGLSDSMAPGTLASLAQSDDVALRVRFIDPAPAQHLLYWRSIVLGDYDGRTWTRVPRRRGPQRQDIAVAMRGQPVRQEITMEASGQRWLSVLELAGPRVDMPGFRVRDSEEMEYFTANPVDRRARYTATSYPDYALQRDAEPQTLARWLELPAGFNPRTLALARQLRQSDPRATAAQLSDQVLAKFRRESFSYTLQPPLGARDLVDDFLFTSRAGFCEHYAGAYVVLMRAMGVPARVVTGYQGGERNPVDDYFTVRQSDAHAWAEIWTRDQGWRRVDPTAAVAPERIARNLARALPAPTGFGFGPLFALQNDPDSWLARVRFRYAALNNAWNQYILDYNPEKQRSFLAELAQLSTALLTWRAALAAVAIAALLALRRRWRQRRAVDPLEALYEAFSRRQARHGDGRQPHEGPAAYAARLRMRPASAEQHAAADQFLLLYGTLKYGAPHTESRTASLATLKNLLVLCR